MLHEDEIVDFKFPSWVIIEYNKEYMERWQHAFCILLSKASKEKTLP